MSIELTPSEYVGAVKQGLEEMHRYLSTTLVPEINAPAVMAHLERMAMMVAQIAQAQAQHANGRDQQEQRPSAE